jgi:hypothetical protein
MIVYSDDDSQFSTDFCGKECGNHWGGCCELVTTKHLRHFAQASGVTRITYDSTT